MVKFNPAVGVFDKLKHVIHFRRDFLITGKQREISVNLRSFLVKVTRTDMRIAYLLITFPAGDQAKLGVNFKTIEAK